ncbi:F0F1 ATP synthase subunit delta [Aeromicrobium sp.]|nr:F0F1 ATP synthase subunit delta [Candidatus Saccharibacteria bacterium]
MKAPRTRISSTIAESTLNSGSSTALVHEIAAYLLSENRVGELNSIMRDVQADWAKAGYVEVLASTAHELSADVRAKITKQVQTLHPDAKQIIVTEVLDPTIIGGVRLSLANRQLDLSVEAKLNKFKQFTLGKA